MDYRMLGEAVIPFEVVVHDATPGPPDVVCHAFRHGSHQPLSFGHRKGGCEADGSRRLTLPEWLHADTLSAAAAITETGPPTWLAARPASAEGLKQHKFRRC